MKTNALTGKVHSEKQNIKSPKRSKPAKSKSASSATNQHQSQNDQQFANAKKQALLDLSNPSVDRSVAGTIDAPIIPLVEIINRDPRYYTTSSCSGRIIVSANSSAAENLGNIKHDRQWKFVSHEPLPENEDGGDFIPRILAQSSTVDCCVLKFEPLILHVRSRDVQCAARLLRIAVQCGLRDSGIMIGGGAGIMTRATVAIRSNIRLEMPLLETMRNEAILRSLVPIINDKMRRNSKTIERLCAALTRELCEVKNETINAEEENDKQ